MLIIFTGNGKGKTTAALGLALRAVGRDNTVLMVQFIKGPWRSGEHNSARRFDPKFRIVKKGKGFVGIGGDNKPLSTHIQAAANGLEYSRKQALSGKWNILILDEIWNALTLNLLTCDILKKFILQTLPAVDHLIMTGRNCPKDFIELADLVTEMREVKHPFSKGVLAKKGLDY